MFEFNRDKRSNPSSSIESGAASIGDQNGVANTSKKQLLRFMSSNSPSAKSNALNQSVSAFLADFDESSSDRNTNRLFGPPMVLLVDDDQMNIEVLNSLLKEEGVKTDSAVSGLLALRMIKERITLVE